MSGREGRYFSYKEGNQELSTYKLLGRAPLKQETVVRRKQVRELRRSTNYGSRLLKIFLLTLVVLVASTELQIIHDLPQYKECS